MPVSIILRRVCGGESDAAQTLEQRPVITRYSPQFVFHSGSSQFGLIPTSAANLPAFIICFIFSICKKEKKKRKRLAAKVTSVSWRLGTVSFACVCLCTSAQLWLFSVFLPFLPSCITSCPSSQPLSHRADCLSLPQRFSTLILQGLPGWGKDGGFVCVFCKLEREGCVRKQLETAKSLLASSCSLIKKVTLRQQ